MAMWTVFGTICGLLAVFLGGIMLGSIRLMKLAKTYQPGKTPENSEIYLVRVLVTAMGGYKWVIIMTIIEAVLAILSLYLSLLCFEIF